MKLKESDKLFLDKQRTIGYSKGLEPKRLWNMRYVANELKRLPKVLAYGYTFKLPAKTLEEIKKEAQAFCDNHFSLHEIKTFEVNLSTMSELQNHTPDELKTIISNIIVHTSVFNLPIKLIPGHSMVGEIQKGIFSIGGKCIEGIEIPFLEIQLGSNLTDLSIATYIHEIVHSQTESVKNYTDDFHNKEVLSIFLEKVAALELDPTGELLRKSEIQRFSHISSCIDLLDRYKRGNNYSFEKVTNASMHIDSTLKGLKLFDIYLTSEEKETKTKMLQDVQSIMDGKIQVEDMLTKYNITDEEVRKPTLIRKHIVR